MRFVLLTFACAGMAHAGLFDIAAAARPCCTEDIYQGPTTFDYAHPPGISQARSGRWVYGLQWAEERDIQQIRVRFRDPYDARAVRVEYWFRNWPYDPPKMPTMEDPVDDPWQGKWLTAATGVACHERTCVWTFRPLDVPENPRAANLPGTSYRRAIKVRLVFPAGPQPPVEPVEVFSESTVRPLELRLAFDQPPAHARFTAYNGRVRAVKQLKEGVLLTVDITDPRPPGSNDVTVVEVHNGEKSFAFCPADVEHGPMLLPDFHVFITLAADHTPPSADLVKHGARIRERLAVEPEQTYQRATREIPPLDPVERQGGRLYVPLAADASWQKFALEWGGNVAISKDGTKAMGRERARLTWPGDRISWRIGTGATPDFRPGTADSSLGVLEDYLPVAEAHWKTGDFTYQEESFATFLSGPLDAGDAARNEQTPAVLMLRLRARNPSPASQAADVWIEMNPAEPLTFAGGLLTADAGQSVRAATAFPPHATAQLERGALHIRNQLPAGAESVIDLAVPFIPGLTANQRAQLTRLDYTAQRRRVVDYWRAVIGRGVPFHIPEERFNSFARALIGHIRISATRDPASGIYMIPAASYFYGVYANEAVFQSQLLDVAGFPDLAEHYLQAQVDLQGSRPFDGVFTGDQKGVYHGARVSPEYDYTSSEYNLDHGAVLWSLGEHYLLTRDQAWLVNVAPSMKRAADWIVAQRSRTKLMVDGEPCPEYGLLPAGHLEDNGDWGHWFSVNAYASVGLTELAEALEDAGDVDAAAYRQEAEAYRTDLRAAVARAAAAAPVIRLRDHTWVPYVPTRAHQRIRLFGPLRVGYYSRYPEKALPTYRLSAVRELLYGPLILFDTGILDANDSMANWVLDDWEDNTTMSEPLGLHVHGWVDEKYWFSRGGMVFQANLQNPIRTYIRRGEARAAVRDLYNDFVACYYPSVNAFTEEFRQWRSPSGPFFKAPDEAKFVHRLRDSLVTEYAGDLLLAAATPERWLAAGQKFSVTAAPTHFGPVTYSMESEGRQVRASVTLPTRNPYRNAWLYVNLPPERKMGPVRIDGEAWDGVDMEHHRIRLPVRRQAMTIDITEVGN